MVMTIEEVQKKNIEMCIPSGWNIYEWSEKHPDTTIAHALKRIEKDFDFADSLQLGFSGGKDSTVSANLACLELNLRKLRVEAGIDRDGNQRIDPLDAKWYGRRLSMAMTDAEVCFTSTNDYTKRFLAKYGPQKCYKLGDKEYKADELLTLSDGSEEIAENIFNRVMLGEEIEVKD